MITLGASSLRGGCSSKVGFITADNCKSSFFFSSQQNSNWMQELLGGVNLALGQGQELPSLTNPREREQREDVCPFAAPGGIQGGKTELSELLFDGISELTLVGCKFF